ncbi:intermembrane transport protein PqiB [Haloferula chungangensis]|uniref:Intermembrane transport protein PqiB n=1 Tax=Haloferula chungangensis TaxID=1048331 RepID=A0ABW2L4K8_9BACT
MSEDPAEFQATVRHRRRISNVWIIPIVAFLLAGWLIWKNYSDKGPLVSVKFETADGIKAGETEVRCRSVRIGVVEKVSLADDIGSVTVDLRIAPTAEDLLRSNSRLWVVRPRVTASDISGLGTLITGAYIELEPGSDKKPASHFIGLEEPPVTSANVPGLRLTLIADDAGSLGTGAPIYYRGFEVGKVERRTLDIEARRIRYEVFIKDEYADLVNSGTRFWNTSGIDVSAGADGFKFRTPSFQAMVVGGASFAVPKGVVSGEPAEDGSVFTLYEDESAARDASFDVDRKALLFFDHSVRGLNRGAPVEFRGIPIGRVVDVTFKYSPPGDSRVPVLIEFDTNTLRRATEDESDGTLLLSEAVRKGLRAKLGTGSLLTGAMFVDIDFVPDAFPATLGKLGEFDVIPTESSGIAQLEAKINALLAKLQALPLDDTLAKFGNAADETAKTVADARDTMGSIESALDEMTKLLGSDETQNVTKELNATLAELRTSVESLGPAGAMQGDLRRTLDELRSALRSFDSLSRSLDEKPNSLLFGRDSSGNPTPKARR